jgi:O-antigen/teichoic acid export membrane protein
MKPITFVKDQYKRFMTNELSHRFINLLSVDVLIKVSGLALMYVYLKVMNESQYGIYGMVVNLIGSASLFMNFGLYIAQTTYFNEYKDNIGKLIFNLNAVLLLFLLLLYILFYYTFLDLDILYYLIGKETKDFNLPRYRIWIWIGITTQVYATMMSNYFIMSKSKIRVMQLFNACRIFITNGITIWILYNYDIEKAYARIKYSMIVDAMVAIPFFIYYIKIIKPELDFKLIINSLKIGLPTMATAIISSVYGLTDRNVLLKYTNGVTLGVYTYAYTLASNLWVFLLAFLGAFWPSFLEENNPKESFKKTIRVTKKVMKLLTLVSIGMFVFAWSVDYFKIISIRYNAAIAFLPAMLFTQLILAWSTMMANYYIYFKKTYIQIFVSLVSLILNWKLCVLLIPSMQTWGAIVATMIATIVVCIYNTWFAYSQSQKVLVRP